MEQNYICPPQALKKWKTAMTMGKAVYIYGIAGSGKTAFVEHALRKRKYVYLSGESLKEQDLRIPVRDKKTIVIVDDMQFMPEEYRDAVRQLLERRDIWLILCARCKIPRWLMPYYTRCSLLVIEEEDLYLDMEGIRQYLLRQDIAVAEDILQLITERTFGNALAVKLLAMELAKGKTYDDSVDKCVRQQVLDYMENCVYDKWEIALQEFFMQVSIVEAFDLELAEMITGRGDVAGILDHAMEIGNFMTEENGNYRIHSNMRLGMLRRMNRFYKREKINDFYYNAGHYYEIKGQIVKALDMYEACGHHERISELLINNARENPASGHFYELKEYYKKLPDEYVLDSVELMAGMSLLQSILMNFEESDRWYQELSAYEKRQKGSYRRLAKSYLVYLDFALPHRGIRGMTDLVKQAGVLIANRDITLPELGVTASLPSQMNGGKDFSEWSKKDRLLANSIGKILEKVLGSYGRGMLNNALAESYFEKSMDNYEVSMLANRGKMEAESGGKLEQEFVSIGILARLHLISGHCDAAAEVLDSFHKKLIREHADAMEANLRAMKVRLALYQESEQEIGAWFSDCVDEEKEFYALLRYQYLTKIRVYFFYGSYERAVSLIHRMIYYAEQTHRPFIYMEARLLLAMALFRQQDRRWKELFEAVLLQAAEYHFVRLISREGVIIGEMLKQGKWEQIRAVDEAFLQEVIRETKRMARQYPYYLRENKKEQVELGENALRILYLQAEGFSAKQIAEKIGIKEETVRYHSKQTYRKLGVSGKAAAVIEARRRGLF